MPPTPNTPTHTTTDSHFVDARTTWRVNASSAKNVTQKGTLSSESHDLTHDHVAHAHVQKTLHILERGSHVGFGYKAEQQLTKAEKNSHVWTGLCQLNKVEHGLPRVHRVEHNARRLSEGPDKTKLIVRTDCVPVALPVVDCDPLFWVSESAEVHAEVASKPTNVVVEVPCAWLGCLFACE